MVKVIKMTRCVPPGIQQGFCKIHQEGVNTIIDLLMDILELGLFFRMANALKF